MRSGAISAIKSGDLSGRQRAEDLVHSLGSRGYIQYRDLLLKTV